MINEAVLLGNVGSKDIKPMRSGGDFVALSLATNIKYTDQNGEKQVKTTWHPVNVFGKLVDVASKYVHVGDMVYIRGEIQYRKVEQGDRAGEYMYSVNAKEITFVKSATSKSHNENGTPDTAQHEQYQHQPIRQEPGKRPPTYKYIDQQQGMDIPF